MFDIEVGVAVTERLEEEATSLAAHLAAGTARWLLVIAELDRREAWASWGCRSMSHWLAWRCGIDARTAREHVRVGRAVTALAVVRDSFTAGELSYSQVRAITRIAEPANEMALVELARHSTAGQLERTVRATVLATHAEDPAGDDDGAGGAELHCGWGEDGRWELTVRGLPAEDGALVEAALSAVADGLYAERKVAGGSAEPLPNRLAEALVRLAQIVLASTPEDLPVSSGSDTQVLVVADEAGCHLDHGPGISDDTARRLACDASIVLLRTHQGEPLDIGRRSRTIPTGIRRVLEQRDHGCRFPECGRRAFTHAHHLLHWTKDGPTATTNLVLLCPQHHGLLHEGHWHTTGHPDTALHFHAPDGRTVTATAPRRASGPDLIHRNTDAGVRTDPTTPVPLWAGEPLDLAAAVDAVLPLRRSG